MKKLAQGTSRLVQWENSTNTSNRRVLRWVCNTRQCVTPPAFWFSYLNKEVLYCAVSKNSLTWKVLWFVLSSLSWALPITWTELYKQENHRVGKEWLDRCIWKRKTLFQSESSVGGNDWQSVVKTGERCCTFFSQSCKFSFLKWNWNVFYDIGHYASQ